MDVVLDAADNRGKNWLSIRIRKIVTPFRSVRRPRA
jgi:hypothetical protein